MSRKDMRDRREYHRAWMAKNAESQRAKRRAWYHENKQRLKPQRRAHAMKVRYGISAKDYEAMWLRQGGKCPVCGNMELDGNQLHVDHDHKTGRVRGLLCGPCNRFIGLAKENIHTLHGAVDYIERQARIPCPL